MAEHLTQEYKTTFKKSPTSTEISEWNIKAAQLSFLLIAEDT